MTVIYLITKHHFEDGKDKKGRWAEIPCQEYVIRSTHATKKEADELAQKLDKRAKFYMYRVKKVALK